MSGYLNELKLAVINGDVKKLEELSQKDPEFSTIEEAQEINAYIKQAVSFLEGKKSELSKEMEKIKKLQKFNSERLKESQTFNFKA